MKIHLDSDNNAHLIFDSHEYNQTLDGIRRLIFSLVKPDEEVYDAAASLVIAMATAMRAAALAEVLHQKSEDTLALVLDQNTAWSRCIIEHMRKTLAPEDKDEVVSDQQREWYRKGESLKE